MARITSLPALAAADATGRELLPVVHEGTTKGIAVVDVVAPAAQPFVDAANLAKDQAADLVLPSNIFVDVALTDAEAGLPVGTTFKVVESASGVADVRRRTAPLGSIHLYYEITGETLRSSAIGKGADIPAFARRDAGAVSRPAGDKLREVASILDFAGADPTGATSSQAAWDAAAQSGKDIFFPAGRYLIDQILLASGQRIFGEGRKSKIEGGRAATGLVVLGSGDNMIVEGLWLHTTVSCYAAVVAFHRDITNSAVRGNYITDAGFSNNGVKIVTDNSAVGVNGLAIERNTIVSPGRMGIEVQNHGVDDWTKMRRVAVRGNIISNAGAVGSNGMGISMSGTMRYCDISENDIADFRSVGIEIIGPCYSHIRRNTISGGNGRPFQVANARLMIGNVFAENIVVAGPNTSTVYFASCNNCDIVNNMFDLRDATGNAYVNITGSAIGHGNNRIAYNTVLTSAYYAIMNDGTPSNEYIGNKLDNSASASNFACLRFYAATSTRCVARGNSLRRPTGGSSWDQTSGAAGNINMDFLSRGTSDVVVNGGGDMVAALAVAAFNVPAGGRVTISVPNEGATLTRYAQYTYSVAHNDALIVSCRGKAGTVDVIFYNPTAADIPVAAGTLATSVRSAS